jgi:hypothetical protein
MMEQRRWKGAASSREKIKDICEVLPNYSPKGKFRQERMVRLSKLC